MKMILAAIDFSDVSSQVAETAGKVARAFGSKLHLVHVRDLAVMPPELIAGAEFGPGPVPPSPLVNPLLVTEPRPNPERLQALAQNAAGGSGGTGAGALEVSTAEPEGTPVETLIAEAEKVNADLIVVGSHGHGALFHLMAGSITQGLLRKAHRPILVVPAQPGSQRKK